MDGVAIVKVPEGESGLIRGKLTDQNIEAIAAVYALPEPVRRRKYGNDDAVVRHLAGFCGMSTALVRRAKRDRRVRARLWESLTETLDFLLPTVVYHQAELAMPPHRDTKAARFLAELASRVKQQAGAAVNVNVQQNVQVNQAAQDGGIREDREIAFWLKELIESGQAARIVAAIPVEEAPEAPVAGTDP